MSRSDHNKSRKPFAARVSLKRSGRAFRRQANRFARYWDDTMPAPRYRPRASVHGGMCGHGCCW